MGVYVYVDGFNLYYRALKGTPYRWINLLERARQVLDPADTVDKVRYFTARVGGRSGDLDAPRRQQLLFSALQSVPLIEFHYGRFLPKTKKRPLVSTGKFVEIHDTEEKGSDVNLASHLINDAHLKRFDTALVLSQDTDLVEPVRIVAKELGLPVGIVWLDGKQPNRGLKDAASFVRHIKPAHLIAAQFPDPVVVGGREIRKPASW